MIREATLRWVERGKRNRLAAYGLSGVTALIIDYGVFLILYYIFKVDVAFATALGLSVGFIASFMLNKLWTFRDRRSTKKVQTLSQIVLYGLLFILNNAFTIFLIRTLLVVGISAAVGKIISTILITLWNYALYKKLIFK
ncbi:MAG: GtrA family protein [Candidatus Saccharimonas sp.]|nr:GtrA family protein [Candidatus Saccharimonas sp.]